MSQQRIPIILVPGLCSTRLLARDRRTGYQECAWVSTRYLPKPRMGERLINDLWGRPDSEGRYRSFLEEVADIDIIEGFPGCEYLAKHFMIDMIHFFDRNFMLGRYFSSLIKYLEKYGYVPEQNLFCFAYDWRQPLFSDEILGSLRAFILEVMKKTKANKLSFIAHSHGALLLRMYMQSFPDWSAQIHRFIALGPPYDNSSANLPMSIINGFALRIPFIKNITARNLQAGSSVPSILGPAPISPDFTEAGIPQYIPTCVFIKKVGPGNYELARATSLAIPETTPMYLTDTKRYRRKLPPLEDLRVSLDKYKKEMPNISALLLKRFIESPDSLEPKYRDQALRILLNNIKPGSIQNIRTGKRVHSRNWHHIDTLLTPQYHSGIPTREAIENRAGLWAWEIYTAWTSEMDEDPYLPTRALEHPWFDVHEDRLLLRRTCPRYQEIMEKRVGLSGEVIRWSARPDILLHAYAISISQSFSEFSALRNIVNIDGKIHRLSTQTDKPVTNFLELDMKTLMMARKDVKLAYHEPPRKEYEVFCKGTSPLIEELSSLTRIIQTGTIRASDASPRNIQIPRPPWNSVSFLQKVQYRSLSSLTRQLSRPKSLEDFLFKAHTSYWEKTREVRRRKTYFPKASDTTFRYFGICGSGLATPLHVIYNQPVCEYHELCLQVPTTITSDGDGTVLLHSALSDGIPSELVLDRVIVKGITHFMLLHTESVWELVSEGLGLTTSEG
ncbi:putative Lecithin-cholesterol acyl transferase [Giardia muris]|uniref:Putative Lecithin-cholesterol acyl transferase n=1 Tax=Giardia muris TaxID=5742 RepID=A0A4Z1SY78_GIAMU|nr:putative Lecithin-cholesterol acyl transferase [Giardia muris]|eukprot:TNJ30646.1 putative Lecithin-cholesterol acyl transferase [Giardia muris]